ncbi:MAG: TonB-dependent receptor [Steroidobacteraceae bacterium]
MSLSSPIIAAVPKPAYGAAVISLLAIVHAAPAQSLDEVIVTATHRPLAVMDYPGSATRIDAAAIGLIGPTHSSELLNRAPGTMIQRGSGQESLTALRSPVLTGAGACGSVLVLEDSIPIRPVGSCNVNELFEVNVEQAAAIEILRGPGSSLYGSSAVHGIINVIPALPEELPAIGVALETGSDAYRRILFAASRESGATGFGIALHATDDGGWRDSSGFTEQKLNAVWTQPLASGDLTIRIAATHLDQETAGFITGEDAYRDAALAHSNPNPEAYRDADSARLTMHYRNGSGLDLHGYLRHSHMDFLQHFLLGQPVEDNGQDSAGILLSHTRTDFAGGELTLGADAELAASSLLQFQDEPTTGGTPAANAIRPQGRQYDYDVDSRVLAGYAQWRRALASNLSLEAGLRLEQAAYNYDNRMIDGNTDENGVPCPGGCLYSRPADRSNVFNNVAQRLGLLWHPVESAAAYLVWARGFRAPEATELYRLQRQQTVADLDSENADSVELGLRWRGSTAGVNLAAFTMDKEDVILRDSAGFNLSGGRTDHRALEYDLDWDFAETWTIAAGGTVARHEYRFTAAVEQGEQITSGNDVDTAPRDIHSLWLRHKVKGLDAELEWMYVGPYWANAANTARYDGHDLMNLRLSWQPHPAWMVALRVTNLLDAAYADRADFAFGNYRYFPGRERAAFVEIGWQKD